MKRILYFNYIVMSCLFLSLFTYCSDDKDDEVVVPATISIDKTFFSIDASASKGEFTVLSNKDWTAETEAAWLALSPASGKANDEQSVEITVSENTETGVRNATITITTGSKVEEVKVEQSGKVVVAGIDIADEKFKQFLVERFDANGDGEISTGEAEAVTVMDCSGKDIKSLAGIEFFVNLDTLNCSSNSLLSVDLSKNIKLTMLNCDSNNLDSLGLSGNRELRTLSCKSNVLTKLNVSNNTKLTRLNCSSNKLTVLDVSYNRALTTLICSGNELTYLDVSENALLSTLDCRGNGSLEKVHLAKNQTISDLLYDEGTTTLEYETVVSNLVSIPDANFKAYLIENFDTDKDGEISKNEALAVTEIRCMRRDIASLSGISSFTNLEILVCNDNKLRSIDVSENLKLRELSCMRNELNSLDVSNNTELTSLISASCDLTSLDVSSNTKLIVLNCSDNFLNRLDVSANTSLRELFCQNNILRTLDLSKNRAITSFNCRSNPNLESVFLDEGHIITSLFVDTPPTSIIHPNYVNVPDANFRAYLIENFDTNNDGRISEAEAVLVESINCSEQGIASLSGIARFTNLTSLVCSGNELTSVDISSNLALVEFICDSNKITSLNISNNIALEVLNCAKNELTSIETGVNVELKALICSDNKLSALNLAGNTKLETLLFRNNNIMRSLDLTKNRSLETLDCRNNPNLMTVYLQAGYEVADIARDDRVTEIRYVGEDELGISIPDANFKAYLVKNFDKDGDREISRAEALLVRIINCSNLEIRSLSGIEYFTNLISLTCDYNELTSLSLSSNTLLGTLHCSDNNLTSLDVSACTNLGTLYCRRNNLSSLNIMRNVELTQVDCQDNNLSNLNIRRNPNLQILRCFDNAPGFIVYMASSQASVNISMDDDGQKIIRGVDGYTIPDALFEDYLVESFDKDGDGSLSSDEMDAVTAMNCSGLGITSLEGVHLFRNLTSLRCDNNRLTSLSFTSDNANLSEIYCHDNRLRSIDVSNCTSLRWLYCPGNLLTSLDVSGNLSLSVLDCTENPGLRVLYLGKGIHEEISVRTDNNVNVVFK